MELYGRANSKKYGSSPRKQQRRTLKWLLERASNTEFGRHYRFDGLLNAQDFLEAFKERVPFHDYDLIFGSWWNKTLEGKPDVTWPGTIRYFALSSGTSGSPSKRIPISKTMFRMLERSALKLFFALPNFGISPSTYVKSWLGIGGCSQLNEVNGHFEGYLSGINANKRPHWANAFYKPGNEISEIVDFDLRTTAIAENADRWDVGMIIGVPHWVQITMERILRHNKVKSLDKIWPNLKVFISGGVDIKAYQKKLDALVGHPLAYMNTYLASEGMIAFQDRPGTTDLKLITNGGIFFEFIPFNEENFDAEGNLVGNPRSLTVEQVDTEQEYAIVVSTCSGAWRYVLGDTVRFTDLEEARIVISGRTKYYLNLCTEHLTSDNMEDALGLVKKKLHLDITEFMVAPGKRGEYFIHKWYVGVDKKIDVDDLRDSLDTYLKRLNDDYRTERATLLLITLKVVPTSFFYEWQQLQGEAMGQSKIPRVIKGTKLKGWEAFLKERQPQKEKGNLLRVHRSDRI